MTTITVKHKYKRKSTSMSEAESYHPKAEGVPLGRDLPKACLGGHVDVGANDHAGDVSFVLALRYGAHQAKIGHFGAEIRIQEDVGTENGYRRNDQWMNG